MISQFSNLYLAICIALFGLILFLNDELAEKRRFEVTSRFELLDEIFNANGDSRPLEIEDIFRSTEKGRKFSSDFMESSFLVPSREELVEMGFDPELARDGRSTTSTLRGHPVGRCTYLVVSRSRARATVGGPSNLSQRQRSYSGRPEISVFDAGGCVGGYRSSLTGFIQSRNGDTTAIAVPHNFIDDLPRVDLFGQTAWYLDILGVREFHDPLEEPLLFFFNVENAGNLVWITKPVFEQALLLHARDILGEGVNYNEIDSALSALFQKRSDSASVFGLEATLDSVIRIAPWLLFVALLTADRILATGRLGSNTERFWYASESETQIDRFLCIVYAALPYLLTVLLSIHYSAFTEQLVLIADIQMWIDMDLALRIDWAWPKGWRIAPDSRVEIYSGMVLWICMAISLSIAQRLLAVSVDSMSKNKLQANSSKI